MDCSPGIMLKNLCCTCLSQDRKLYQLNKIPDGINNLYCLLSLDSEAYKEGFYKDKASLFMCWECRAILRKIRKFRQQACVAQKKLTCIADGQVDIKSLTVCLSHLSHNYKDTYDDAVLSKTESSLSEDNFIDCGPLTYAIKAEPDIDNISLSEIQINCNQNDNFNNNSTSENKKDENKSYDVKLQPENQINLKIKEEGKIKSAKKITINVEGGKIYYNATSIKREMSASGGKIELSVVATNSVFKCKSCFKSFKSKTEFQNHNILHVRSEMPKVLRPETKPEANPALMNKQTPSGYLCMECNKCFKNKNQRWKHVQRYHREGYQCDICGKRFAFKNNLSKHIQLHEKLPPREECPSCHKMVRVDLMQVHSRIHSNREQSYCAECDKHFISRASYEHHLRYTQAHAVIDILKYKCSVCDKGYRSQGELRDHVNYQHMGKTQHKCPICSKALATRRCITRHVRRAHQGVKENTRDKICEQCGKAFRDKKGLREHEFIHTGERPLSCEICGCTFRQSSSLYTHRKRVHKICPQKKNVEILDTEDTQNPQKNVK